MAFLHFCHEVCHEVCHGATDKNTYKGVKLVKVINEVCHGLPYILQTIKSSIHTTEFSISWILIDFMIGHKVKGIVAECIVINYQASCHWLHSFHLASSDAVGQWSRSVGPDHWQTFLMFWNSHTIVFVKSAPVASFIRARIVKSPLNHFVFILPNSEAWIVVKCTATNFFDHDLASRGVHSRCTLEDDCSKNHDGWFKELHCWLLLIGSS